MEVLKIENLNVEYYTPQGILKAVNNVNLTIKHKGEVLGLVGESGCGKSTLGYAIAGLLPENARIASGKIIINGVDVTKSTSFEKPHVAVIFQDAMTSLNPVLTVGEQLAEIYVYHEGLNWSKAYKKTSKVLEEVGLPKDVIKRYPHELSGGQRQRVLIAMAMALNPPLIIADEPTTALDVTVQARVLKILHEVVRKNKLTMLYITHDLSLVAHMCNKVAVMYAGEIVEYGDIKSTYKDPKHPYTKALLNAIPRIDKDIEELISIEGTLPSLINPPSGCRFHPRCPYVMDRCKNAKPKLITVNGERAVRCFLYE